MKRYKYRLGWKETHIDQGKVSWTWRDFLIIAIMVATLVIAFYYNWTR